MQRMEPGIGVNWTRIMPMRKSFLWELVYQRLNVAVANTLLRSMNILSLVNQLTQVSGPMIRMIR